MLRKLANFADPRLFEGKIVSIIVTLSLALMVWDTQIMSSAFADEQTDQEAAAQVEESPSVDAGDQSDQGGSALSGNETAATPSDDGADDAVPADEQAGDKATNSDDKSQATEGKDGEQASAADATDGEDTDADADSEDGEDTDADADEEDADDEELEYPAVTLEGSANGVAVTVEAPEGALPEGTKMEVVGVDSESVRGTVEGAIGSEVEELQGVSLKFSFKDKTDGDEVKEVDPKKDVTIKLRSDALVDIDEPIVVHVDKDGIGSVVGNAFRSADDQMTLTSAEGRTYVVVEKKNAEEEATEEAAEGDDAEADTDVKEGYEAKSFHGIANGVIVNVEAPDGAFPEGTEMHIAAVSSESVADAVEAAVGEDATAVKAVDITFTDADGNEIEPEVAIDVSLRSNAIAAVEAPMVVHVADDGTGSVVGSSAVADNEVAFSSDEFSVYVVVEDGGTGANARLTITFKTLNAQNEWVEVDSIKVKKDDNMEQVLYDPGAGTLAEGVYFRGWTADENYTTETDALDIAGVRDEVAGMLDEGVVEGATCTYYAMLFKDYRITYFDENDISLGQEEVSFRADSNSVEQEYTVNMAYTVQDDEHNFEGWLVKEGADNIISAKLSGEDVDPPYENTTVLTIKGDVELSVNAPEGHWLVFNENGKGAKYNAPQFVYADGKTEKPCPDAEMTRRGYSFGGWYTDKDCTEGHEFVFGKGLTQKTVIYAKWIPIETAGYTVIIWTQNADRTGYDVKATKYVESAQVGQNIPYTFVNNKDEDYVTINDEPYHYTGFCLQEADAHQEVKVTPEGDAVLNLHFDRIEYNLRFYLYRQGTGNNSYQYAENSRSGSNVWGIATWYGGTNLNNMPKSTYEGGIQSQRDVDGYTGYFITLSAYYGENIIDRWPKYKAPPTTGNR